MRERSICIHGHFYQPPRENAWTEVLGRQPSAHPHHDWNARISSECYGPNARARILDEQGFISRIQSNYARMSFNFGATLLSWLESEDPRVYRAIIDSDAESRAHFGGHGSAMAQAYNHVIMPLANDRDRATQVRWGVRDFEKRFGRKPEGMWLPETAADTPSLEALAAEGISFTILCPRQAKRVRKIGRSTISPKSRRGGKAAAASRPGWTEVNESTLDTERPYRVELPSGRSINVFFYDGSTSQAVAFERLLSDGTNFFRRLAAGFKTPETAATALLHIATDGETYGHHHRFGEMALAWALRAIEKDPTVKLTNYAQYLAEHPPEDLAEINERTSWSCFHGVGRWCEDCGCRTRGGSSQAWRAPLRRALDALRTGLDEIFEREGRALFVDPWVARDQYIEVVLDRSRTDSFLAEQGRGPLSSSPGARVRALELLEMQRFAMLMYTSCGWFFDDVDGLETTQILEYAGRAIDLADRLAVDGLLGPFLKNLEAASARFVFEKRIREARVDADRVATTSAILASLGSSLEMASRAHTTTAKSARASRRGESALVTGHLKVIQSVTGAETERAYALLRDTDGALDGSVWDGSVLEEEQSLHQAFDLLEFDSVRARIKETGGRRIDSLQALPIDEQARAIDFIASRTIALVDRSFRSIHQDCEPILKLIAGLATPPPKALVAASKLVLSSDIVAELGRAEPDFDKLDRLVKAAHQDDVHLDLPDLELRVRSLAARFTERIENNGPTASDADWLRLARTVDLGKALSRTVDLSRAQDMVWDLCQRTPTVREDRRVQDLAARLGLLIAT